MVRGRKRTKREYEITLKYVGNIKAKRKSKRPLSLCENEERKARIYCICVSGI